MFHLEHLPPGWERRYQHTERGEGRIHPIQQIREGRPPRPIDTPTGRQWEYWNPTYEQYFQSETTPEERYPWTNIESIADYFGMPLEQLMPAEAPERPQETREARVERERQQLTQEALGNNMVPDKPPRYTHNGWQYYDATSNTYIGGENTPSPEHWYHMPKHFLEDFYGREALERHQPSYEEFRNQMVEQGVLPNYAPRRHGQNYEYFNPLRGEYVGPANHGNIPPTQYYNAPEEYIQRYFHSENRHPEIEAAAEQSQIELQSQFANRPQNAPLRINTPRVPEAIRNIREPQPTQAAHSAPINPVMEAQQRIRQILMPFPMLQQMNGENPALIAQYANEILQQEQNNRPRPQPRRQPSAYEMILRHFNPGRYHPEVYPGEDDGNET